MGDHSICGAQSGGHRVIGAEQDLLDLWQGKRGLLQSGEEFGNLIGSGQDRAEISSIDQGGVGLYQIIPRIGQIQEYGIHVLFLETLCYILQSELHHFRQPHPFQISTGQTLHLRADLVGIDAAVGTDGVGQREGHPAAAGTCLDHPATGADIHLQEDVTCLLGINDLRGTAEAEDQVMDGWGQEEIGETQVGGDVTTPRATDQVVVGQDPLVGLSGLAWLEAEDLPPSLGIHQEGQITRTGT